MGLTARQKLFVASYLQCWNATKAAIAAGYSPRTAAQIGYENMRKPEISEEIKRNLDTFTLTAAECLYHLARIARGDIANFLTDDGQLDLASARASGSMYALEKLKRRGKGFELEMRDALKALELLLKYHGLIEDKLRISLIVGDASDSPDSFS